MIQLISLDGIFHRQTDQHKIKYRKQALFKTNHMIVTKKNTNISIIKLTINPRVSIRLVKTLTILQRNSIQRVPIGVLELKILSWMNTRMNQRDPFERIDSWWDNDKWFEQKGVFLDQTGWNVISWGRTMTQLCRHNSFRCLKIHKWN